MLKSVKDERNVTKIVSTGNLTVQQGVRQSLETVEHLKKKFFFKGARLKRELVVGQRGLAAGEAEFEVALERSAWGEGPWGKIARAKTEWGKSVARQREQRTQASVTG